MSRAGDRWADGRVPLPWLAVAALVAIGLVGWQRMTEASPIERTPSTRRGQALFAGEAAIRGRLRGHQSGLPPAVLRCANCHAAHSRGAPGQALAPAIDRELLVEARVRRGGPPSSYDRASFCKLLRTGVDPASILVAREMPTFEIDDAACADLWRFLTAGGIPRGQPQADKRGRPR